MTFGELLRENGDAIVRRWLDDALSTYSKDSSAAFKRRKDPFGNPVGHALRVATATIFETLLAETLSNASESNASESNASESNATESNATEPAKMHEHLREVVKMRAVQQFSASQAVGFIFRLKQAVRTKLEATVGDSRFPAELLQFDQRVDRIAMEAFDIYVECRERLSELRINEVKRRVAWVVHKMDQRGVDPELAPADSE